MDGGVEAWRERWRDGEMEGRMEKWKDGGMEGEMKGKLDGQTDACSGSLPTRVLAGRTSLCRPLSPRQPAQALLPTPGVQRGWSLQLQHPRVLHVPRESCCTQVPEGLHLPRPWLAAGPAAGGCPIAAPPPPFPIASSSASTQHPRSAAQIPHCSPKWRELVRCHIQPCSLCLPLAQPHVSSGTSSAGCSQLGPGEADGAAWMGPPGSCLHYL